MPLCAMGSRACGARLARVEILCAALASLVGAGLNGALVLVGARVQPVVDMTPSKGEVRELLGGQVTISGLYEQVGAADLNVVVRALCSLAPALTPAAC